MENLGILSITGEDAASFLQGYVTSDLDEVEEKCGAPTALTDIKGRVLANGWHFGSSECVSLVIHASLLVPIFKHLDRYMVFSKSKLNQVATNLDLTAKSSSKTVVLNPMGWGLHPRKSATVAWPRLLLEAKFPLVTDQTSGSFLPQMLSLTEHNAVSFTKGCYLGQEIVARAQHRGAVKRHLALYSVTKGPINVGDNVGSGKRKAGVVVGTYADKAMAVTNGAEAILQSEEGTRLVLLENED